MRNRLVGEAQRNIDERFVLDVRQARLTIGGLRVGAMHIAVDDTLLLGQDAAHRVQQTGRHWRSLGDNHRQSPGNELKVWRMHVSSANCAQKMIFMSGAWPRPAVPPPRHVSPGGRYPPPGAVDVR